MDARERGGGAELPWMVALAVLTLVFFLSFFNRFAGLRSGDGEFYCGMAWLQGHLPYRDYFSATPPLNTLKSVLLLKLFGPYLIVSRMAGVVERVLIVLVLFRWLARLFPLRFAFLASFVTIVVSAGDRSDPVASYNHDALFFAILSGYAAGRVLAMVDELDKRWLLPWSVVAGFFAALSLLTKQTVGLGAAVVVPVAVIVLLMNRGAAGSAWRWSVGFAGGCVVPLLAFAAWLGHAGLAGVFLAMVFRKGPAAKGGHAVDFLLREVRVAWANWSWVLLAVVAIVLCRRAVRRSESGRVEEVSGRGKLARFSLAAAVVLLAGEALAYTKIPALEDFGKGSIYFVLLLLTAMVAGYFVASFRRRLTPREAQFALFAVVSFSAGVMLSLSWPAFEAITLPGLGFLLAATLDGTKEHSRRFVYLVVAAMVFLQVREKLALPFSFGSLEEAPVREASARSNLPELRGMRLPMETRDFVDQTTAILIANSRPSDTIFTYPEMGLFYALTDRSYPTLSGSHNVDVVNDSFAEEESQRLLAQPPAAIVFFAPSAAEVRQEDETWRFGRPSGQHILVATIEGMLPGYRLAGEYRVSSESRVIDVYVRR